MIFCTVPSNCPYRRQCKRNVENWAIPPPIKVFETHWPDPQLGCRGFVSFFASGGLDVNHTTMGEADPLPVVSNEDN